MTDASFWASGYALMIEREKIELEKANVRTSRIRIKYVLARRPENLNLLQGVFDKLPRIFRI